MATVRIFKIAELLGTTSQEVTALLKRDHGIEVKSASSTIEEVVGRQFVERLARQRNIALPGGDMFAETPVVNTAQLLSAVAALAPQSQALIGVQRGDKALQLKVTVVQRPKPQRREIQQ